MATLQADDITQSGQGYVNNSVIERGDATSRTLTASQQKGVNNQNPLAVEVYYP